MRNGMESDQELYAPRRQRFVPSSLPPEEERGEGERQGERPSAPSSSLWSRAARLPPPSLPLPRPCPCHPLASFACKGSGRHSRAHVGTRARLPARAFALTHTRTECEHTCTNKQVSTHVYTYTHTPRTTPHTHYSSSSTHGAPHACELSR